MQLTTVGKEVLQAAKQDRLQMLDRLGGVRYIRNSLV